MSEMLLSSFTMELLMMAEKGFTSELNLYHIFEVLDGVISSDTRQLRA